MTTGDAVLFEGVLGETAVGDEGEAAGAGFGGVVGGDGDGGDAVHRGEGAAGGGDNVGGVADVPGFVLLVGLASVDAEAELVNVQAAMMVLCLVATARTDLT